jgi:hypothetical protein
LGGLGLDWRVQEVEEKETSRCISPAAETQGHGRIPAGGGRPGGRLDLHAAAAVR